MSILRISLWTFFKIRTIKVIDFNRLPNTNYAFSFIKESNDLCVLIYFLPESFLL